jgi:hypothetical protein
LWIEAITKWIKDYMAGDETMILKQDFVQAKQSLQASN